MKGFRNSRLSNRRPRPKVSHEFTPGLYPHEEISNSGQAGYDIRARAFSTDSVTQHLLVLKHFLLILDLVAGTHERLVPPDLTMNVRVKNFLLLAEARYSRYLELLCSQTGPAFGWPLPPWDVAMIFHAHMLSPFAFMADMRYRPKHEKLWRRGIIFPLQRLSNLVKNGQNSDPKSETEWLEAFPRDIYNYPSGKYCFDDQTSFDTMEKVVFACPWCQKKNRYPPGEWISFRSDDMSLVCRCKWFRASTVSIKNIYNDYRSLPVRNRITEHYRIIKGLSHVQTLSDEQISETVEALQTKQPCPELDMLLKDSPLHATDAVIFVPFPHFGSKTSNMIISAYETPWPDFSLDLTAAVLRQIPFSVKITKLIFESSISINERVEQGRARYLKFMSLIKENSGTFVPTLEVDLVWHTHQLFAAEYHFWCEGYVGHRVNHDDTIGQEDLKKSLETTRLTWALKYNDEYLFTDNERQEPGILELRQKHQNEKLRAESELRLCDSEIEILQKQLEGLMAASEAAREAGAQEHHTKINRLSAEHASFLRDYNSKMPSLLFHPRRFYALFKDKSNRTREFSEIYYGAPDESEAVVACRERIRFQQEQIAAHKTMREKMPEENDKKLAVLQEAITSCLAKSSNCNSRKRFLTSIHRPTSNNDPPIQDLQNAHPSPSSLHGGSDGYGGSPSSILYGGAPYYGGRDEYGNDLGGSGGGGGGEGGLRLKRVIEYEALLALREKERRRLNELTRSRYVAPPISSYRSSNYKSNTYASSNNHRSDCGSCGSAAPAQVSCGSISYSSNTTSNDNNNSSSNDTSNCGSSNCGGGCGGD